MKRKFSIFTEVGRAIVFGSINIIKRTWKWTLAVIFILAVVHGMATLILGRQVENEIAKIRAKGDPISLTELAGKPIPDAENGAVIYEKVFKLLDALPDEETKILSDYGFLPKGLERARETLKKNDEIFLLVERAMAKPQCRFKTNWKGGFMSNRYYNRIRHLARIIALRSMVNAIDGNTSEALKSLRMGYKISDSIKDEPSLIVLEFITNIIAITYRSLRFVAEYTTIDSAEAENTISTISQIDLVSRLVSGMKGERVCALNNIDNVKVIGSFYLEGRLRPASWFELSYLGRPLFYLNKANYLKKMNKMIDQDILIPSRNLPKDISDKQNWSNELSNIFLLSNEIRSKVDTGQAILTGGQIFLALCAYKHQYGSYPETLSELKSKTNFKVSLEDPFSGKDFIYKRQWNGFLLYSIGENLKDDGGDSSRPYSAISSFVLDDIVWQMDH